MVIITQGKITKYQSWKKNGGNNILFQYRNREKNILIKHICRLKYFETTYLKLKSHYSKIDLFIETDK